MEQNFSKVIELFKNKTKKDCYKIDVVFETPNILDDKIGGMPYLPIGEEYPKDKNGDPLALLLQVNLKNIDLEGYPKKGILEIFSDKDVDYPCQYAIKYFDEGLEYQTDFPDIDLSDYIVKEGLKINLSKDICYMSIGDYRCMEILCDIINEVYGTELKDYDEIDNFFKRFEWNEELCAGCNNSPITFGGYPDFTQNDPRCYLEELQEKDECLFKLDSCADYDTFSIGDSGILFALISKNDIKNCNFEKGFVDWDCC